MKIVSANMCILQPGLSLSGGGDMKLSRWERFLNRMKQEEIDVALVSEVWGCRYYPSQKNQFKKSAQKMGYRVVETKYCVFSDLGLLILVKNDFRVLHSSMHLFSHDYMSFSERMLFSTITQNGVLYAMIQGPDKTRYHLFTTHMNHNLLPSKNGSFSDNVSKTILTNLYEMKNFVWAKTNMKKDKIIIAGDFNLSPNVPADKVNWETLVSMFGAPKSPTDQTTIVGGFLTPMFWKQDFSSAKYCVDHIFSANCDIQEVEVQDWKLSDHKFLSCII